MNLFFRNKIFTKSQRISPLLSPQCAPIPFLLSVCLSSIEDHGPPSPLGGHCEQHESVRAIWGRILSSFSVVARWPRCAYMQHRNRPLVVPGRCLAKTTGNILYSAKLCGYKGICQTHFVPRFRGGILEKCSKDAILRDIIGRRRGKSYFAASKDKTVSNSVICKAASSRDHLG
jgi:hypothetical protein